jgi:small glutamine-rich tetratricopeptide repeat-containing protein alpha
VTAKGFFRGTEAGEPEYKDRYRKMVLRFKDKVKTQQAGAAAAPAAGAAAALAAADAPPPPPAPSAAAGDEAAAEAFKNDGNAKLQAKDFEGAVACYTSAIQASPDGPKSHIYFANRAAARQYLKQHQVGRLPSLSLLSLSLFGSRVLCSSETRVFCARMQPLTTHM